MKINNRKIFACVLVLATGFCTCAAEDCSGNDGWKANFINPPNKYRPQPFWHINGTLTTERIYEQISDAYKKDGFGGVAILPLSEAPIWGGKGICPGTSPIYLSEGYFERYKDIIEGSDKQGTNVILYDDADFPSGTLGGKLQQNYPQYTQKRLNKQEREITGPSTISEKMPVKDLFMGVVAMNEETFERIDLTSLVSNGVLVWKAPAGKWKLMSFNLEYNIDTRLDYMDGEAIDKFISFTYNEYAKRFGQYLGNTIQKTFFDDVGYLGNSRYWNVALTEQFEKRYNKNAILYYPALWYNIGPDTEAARTAFFGLRAEMIGEGYPRKVAEWSERHGVSSMGHPPGNYEPTTVDMYGDPFKYYRHTQIPLMDAIHGYPYGRPGFKLVSSAADVLDRPVVAVEIFGNYEADIDSFMLYRGTMEVMARGVNFIVPHGMWYSPDIVKIPPLIAHYSKILGPALHNYSDYVARSVSLLQGGNRVADIALLYPIQSLEAWYQFDSGRPGVGKDVPPHTDYNKIGDLLTGQIRQDFTFLHPEEFLKDKYIVKRGKIILNTQNTGQAYKLLIMPSMKVLSVETLKRISDFYNSGGKVLATNQLPSKSAEFGRDAELIALIKEMFGIDPVNPMPANSITASNANGGKIIFLPVTEKEELRKAIDKLLTDPDVKIEEVPALSIKDDPNVAPLGIYEYRNLPAEKLGMFSYIHKQKDGRDIFFFANSTNAPVDTWVTLKGKLKLEEWNPYTGKIKKQDNMKYEKSKSGEDVTRVHLQLGPVVSTFFVSK